MYYSKILKSIVVAFTASLIASFSTVVSADSGEFDVVSYNIHGNLGFGGVGASTRQKMGAKLQSDINRWKKGVILGVQEDWEYVTPDESWEFWKNPSLNPADYTKHSTCNHWKSTRKPIRLKYQSKIHKVPAKVGPLFPFKYGSECYTPIGNTNKINRWAWNDGLNLFSSFQFDTSLYRETWKQLDRVYLGEIAAYKGFSKATLTISGDFRIDVYNVHAGPSNLRPSQFTQLTKAIKKHSAGKAVIVLGDTNLSWSKAVQCKGIKREKPEEYNCGKFYFDSDLMTFRAFLGMNDLKSACQEAKSCEDPKWNYRNGVIIDQIMYRGNSEYSLELVDFEQLDYTTAAVTMSDHEPIRARLRWKKLSKLTGAKIDGANSVKEANSETYACLAQFEDGSSEAVRATWSLVSVVSGAPTYAHLQPLDDGRATLSARAVEADKKALLRCSFEYFGNVSTAVKEVQIKDGGALYRLEIQGPDRIANTTFGVYSSIVHWPDGTSEPQEATWSVTAGGAYAEIQYADRPNIKLVTKQKVNQEQTVTIQSEFIWAQEKKAITKDVAIYPTVGPDPGTGEDDKQDVPVVVNISAANAPSLPGLRIACKTGPDDLSMSPNCPVLRWKGHDYWALSLPRQPKCYGAGITRRKRQACLKRRVA